MKIQGPLLTAIAIFTSISGTSLVAMPQLATKCEPINSIAKGGSSVYFNEDCSTAYVAPPAFGSVEVNDISLKFNQNDCSGYDGLREEIKFWEKTKTDLRMSMFSPPPGVSLIDHKAETMESINMVDSFISEIYTKDIGWYKKIEGLKSHLIFDMDYEGHIGKYKAANPNGDREIGIEKWMRIPLNEAKLYAANSAAGDSSEGDVTNLSILGSEDPEFVFNGAASGSLVLSQNHLCNLLNRVEEGTRTIEEELTSYSVPNVKFKYNVQIPFGYEASFTGEEFFEQIEKKKNTTILFWSKNEHSIENGHYGDENFSFKFTNGHEALSGQEQMQIMQEVKASMVGKLAQHLVRNSSYRGSDTDLPLPTVDKDGVKSFGDAMASAVCETAGFGAGTESNSDVGSAAQSTALGVMTGGLSLVACPAAKIAAALLNIVSITESVKKTEISNEFSTTESVDLGTKKELEVSMTFLPEE